MKLVSVQSLGVPILYEQAANQVLTHYTRPVTVQNVLDMDMCLRFRVHAATWRAIHSIHTYTTAAVELHGPAQALSSKGSSS